jgi:Carboxypeptidase regulatory-like domain
LNTGGLTETQADSAGRFRLFRLAPGDYEVTASADGFSATTAKVTLNLGGDQTLNLSVTAASAQPQAPGANLPNAPSSSKTEPSLSGLGFSQEQVQGNGKEQALLDKRTRMLKIHQKLGLITTAPLIATVVTSIGAGRKKTSTPERTAHMVLGAAPPTCTSPPLTLPSAPPGYRERRAAAAFVSTRPWPGFTVRA